MIREFGFTAPLLIDEDDMILAGHGRTMAATKLKFTELPVVVLRGLTATQKRAIVIADNQASEQASWDDALLKFEIGELKKADFDLKLLGFPDLQLVEFTSGLGNGQEPEQVGGDEGATGVRDLTEDEAAQMNKAWRILAAEWLGFMVKREAHGFLSTSFTKGAMAVFFLRAKFFGSAIPSAASLAYTPHRIDTSAHTTDPTGSMVKGLTRAAAPDSSAQMLTSLQFINQGVPKFDKLLGMTLGIYGFRMPGEFPVDIARSLYDEFVPQDGAVLDPCHGWGGRMLGFLLAKNAKHYEGFDTDPKSYRGVSEMFGDLGKFAAFRKTAKLTCEPFEDVEIAAEKFDFALTSPPYFNVEKYGGEESSWRRYGDFEKWVNGFYAPMIGKVARALKPGAVFALQVGNQSYPLEATAKAVGDLCGLAHVETRKTGMINNYTKTDEDDGEVIMILRKGGGGDPAEKFGRVL